MSGETPTVRATATTTVLMVVTSGVTAVVAGPLIRILYGAQFLPAVSVLRIMLPGIACLGIANVLSQYLGAAGIPRILVFVWAGAAIVLSVLSVLLVPGHAGAGAAAALSATYGALLVAIFFVAQRHRRLAGDGTPSLTPIRVDVEEVPPSGE